MRKRKKLDLNDIIYRIVTIVSIVFIILTVLFLNKPKQIDVKVGDIASENIYSPSSITDTAETEKRKQMARDNEGDKYSRNENANKTATIDVDKLFNIAENQRRESDDRRNSINSQSIEKLQQSSPIKIDDATAEVLLSASSSRFEEMRELSAIVGEENKENFHAVSVAHEACSKKIDFLDLDSKQKEALEKITVLVIKEPTMVFDLEKTSTAKEKAASEIKEVKIRKGEVIVRQGDEVTKEIYDKLRDLGLVKGSNQTSSSHTAGIILLLMVCFAIVSFYFSKQEKKNPVSVPITACCALLVILIVFYIGKFLTDDMASILPVGIFPGIVTIFSSAQLAITTNFVVAVFCAIAFNANWGYAVCIIIAGTMSSYCFSAVKRRSHLLPASIASSVFYGLAFCSLSLVESPSIADAFFSFLKGFAGGFISGLVTIGSLPLVEWLFNATTPMKLSELANPENKLLKRLLVEAPGTYHHSLTVANISEIAARSIKADSLLTRVGAYYHDIGKLRNPHYFKENQYGENPHDELEPEESSELIICHVTDGVEIATKNRLPQNIIDIVEQHHGTTSTGYFLIRAREKDPNVDESLFSYPGPAPQSKEAAIVMLADSCEAAVRSIEDKTEAKIESMVRRIATDRVNTGQFSHCNMTFEELETVIKVITKTLGGYFHDRIKYE